MRTYPVEAIVLRRRDLGENDKLLTLLTKDRGRFAAVARGARKAASPLAGATETLSVSRFLLAKGRQFEYVTQAQPLRAFSRLRADLDRLAHAAVMAELLERTLGEHEPNEPVYALALLLLELFDGEGDPGCVLLWGEMRLMERLGYAPLLNECARCHHASLGRKPAFSPSAGGLVCEDCAAALKDRLPLPPVAAEELRMLAGAAEPPESLRAAGALRRVMRDVWRHVLDADLRSARFLDELTGR